MEPTPEISFCEEHCSNYLSEYGCVFCELEEKPLTDEETAQQADLENTESLAEIYSNRDPEDVFEMDEW